MDHHAPATPVGVAANGLPYVHLNKADHAWFSKAAWAMRARRNPDQEVFRRLTDAAAQMQAAGQPAKVVHGRPEKYARATPLGTAPMTAGRKQEMYLGGGLAGLTGGLSYQMLSHSIVVGLSFMAVMTGAVSLVMNSGRKKDSTLPPHLVRAA